MVGKYSVAYENKQQFWKLLIMYICMYVCTNIVFVSLYLWKSHNVIKILLSVIFFCSVAVVINFSLNSTSNVYFWFQTCRYLVMVLSHDDKINNKQRIWQTIELVHPYLWQTEMLGQSTHFKRQLVMTTNMVVKPLRPICISLAQDLSSAINESQSWKSNHGRHTKLLPSEKQNPYKLEMKKYTSLLLNKLNKMPNLRKSERKRRNNKEPLIIWYFCDIFNQN